MIKWRKDFENMPTYQRCIVTVSLSERNYIQLAYRTEHAVCEDFTGMKIDEDLLAWAELPEPYEGK